MRLASGEHSRGGGHQPSWRGTYGVTGSYRLGMELWFSGRTGTVINF